MRFSRKFGAAGIAILGVLVFASVAAAHPTGEFKPFGECPVETAGVTDCVFSLTNAGSFAVGGRTVPLSNPIVLRGGFSGAGAGIHFYGATNGETLSKTPQPVPGGLLGIMAPTGWSQRRQKLFNERIDEGPTGVTATIELAAPATSITLSTENLINTEGTALGLPAKVKLDNALLGNHCYIGSNAEPIQIDLTTGSSGSLSGAAGKFSLNPKFTLSTISGAKLVNGTFAAPGASGCGGSLSFLVDPLIDVVLGIPSASGENSAVLEGVLKDGQAAAVKASDP